MDSIAHFRVALNLSIKASLVHNHSYKNDFNLLVNEISFSYEKMGTKTHFEEEAKCNSEMAYYMNSTCMGLQSLTIRKTPNLTLTAY